MDPRQFLEQWFYEFAKNRDLIHRKIDHIDEQHHRIYFKTYEQLVVVEPFFGDIGNMLQVLEKEKHYALVCFNTRENFKKLIEHWNSFVEFRFLTLYFVNPFSNQDKKWVVVPSTHSRIADPGSLKTGLKAMFDMVDEFMADDVNRLEA